MISAFFGGGGVMRTPSLFLSLCLSFFHHLAASPDSDASLCRRRREAWQADWLLQRGRFGQLPTLCFTACLKLDLFPLLDFAAVCDSSTIPHFIPGSFTGGGAAV